MELCPPTREAVALIMAPGLPIVEIGAGEGAWLKELVSAGADVEGWDVVRRVDDVRLGNHHEAARDGALMLAVWPPDGWAVADWIKVAAWGAVAVAASWGRLQMHNALAPYRQVASLDMGGGVKGHNELRVFERRA